MVKLSRWVSKPLALAIVYILFVYFRPEKKNPHLHKPHAPASKSREFSDLWLLDRNTVHVWHIPKTDNPSVTAVTRAPEKFKRTHSKNHFFFSSRYASISSSYTSLYCQRTFRRLSHALCAPYFVKNN